MQDWIIVLIELFSNLTLAVVALFLLLSLVRQFEMLGAIGVLLDRLAILPQWKFFGQSYIAKDLSCFDDMCLLARISPDQGDLGPWQNVLWWEDQPIHRGFWNPALRSRSAMCEAMTLLATTEVGEKTSIPPTALAYLTILRHCYNSLIPNDGVALQFAIAKTRGRQGRSVSLKFLSAWHSP